MKQSSPRANGMMKDGAIITKGEWNDEGWSNHHQGRMAIRPYDAAEGIRKGELLFAPIDQASNAGNGKDDE